MILVIPTIMPKIIAEPNISFLRDLAINAKEVRKKAKEAWPETKEQFLLQLSEIVNMGVKFLLPPNSLIFTGLALPNK